MNRRSFIKGLMALASAPAIGKYVNVFKTEGAREGIEQVASKGVDFFNSVIRKVMDEGTLIKEEDRIKTFTHPERSDVMVDVNMGDGTTSVYFDTDEGSRAMGQIAKTADETTKGRTVEELYEAEEIYGPYGKEEQEGIAGGISNLEKFVKKKYAAGGRVGFKSGKLVKDGIAGLLRSVRSKFGKDSIKTVEDEPEFFNNMEVSPYFNIKRPEAAIRRDQFKNFGKPGKFNEDGTIDYDYYAEILNDAENDFVTGGESIEELEIMLKARLDEQAYMYDQYITGKLDPKKGESGRESFLQKKLDEVESSGDRRLITLEELDELDELKGGPGRPPGFVPRGLRNVPVEMMTARIIRAKYPQIPDEMVEQIASLPNDKKALALADLDQTIMLMKTGRSSDEIIEIMKREPETKMADGGSVDGDVSLTVIKIPDISESGVESLFKRR